MTLGRSLPAEVLEKIVAHAEGVPLYVEELTKSVLESGLLREVGDQYALQSPLSPIAIPSSLKDSLLARLDRLEPAKDAIAQVKDVIHIGACIGREFSHELIARVSALDEARLGEVLDKLTEAGLVYRRGTPPDATYTFKHALVQDAAYETLLRSKRPGLHKQIADALEKEFPQLVANKPELLAHHRTQAGDLTAAIPLWRKAGEFALARVALPEAVAYLQEGLAIVGHSADRDSAELSLRERLHSALLQWRGWARRRSGTTREPSSSWLNDKADPRACRSRSGSGCTRRCFSERGWASPEVGDNAQGHPRVGSTTGQTAESAGRAVGNVGQHDHARPDGRISRLGSDACSRRETRAGTSTCRSLGTAPACVPASTSVS